MAKNQAQTASSEPRQFITKLIMPHSLTRDQLAERMRRIRKTDTKPEWVVRRLLHGMGYRYRLHCANLPGTPDIVFPGRRKIIFVHGCFWHQHDCKLGQKKPSANPDYWHPKLARNIRRDSEHREHLKVLGWNVLVIWECQTRDPGNLPPIVQAFLEGT